MAIKIYEETQRDKIIKKYRSGMKHRFYPAAHIIFVLLVFELLIFFAYESQVELYNGMEFWFQLVRLEPLTYILPGGTLIISLVLIAPRAFHIWLDRNGIKDKKEAKNAKKDKKKFNPNWDYFSLIIAEGFIYGSLIYIFLPPVNPLILQFLFENPGPPPTPIDANDSVWGLHTNAVLDLALAFGSGFYDEYIFRDRLTYLLQKPVKKRVKTTVAKVAVPFYKDVPLLTVKDEQKLNMGVMILSGFLFSLSHYILPYSDPFNVYGFVYRFVFGIIMYMIYKRFSLPIAIWTHIFYDIWYFLLA